MAGTLWRTLCTLGLILGLFVVLSAFDPFERATRLSDSLPSIQYAIDSPPQRVVFGIPLGTQAVIEKKVRKHETFRDILVRHNVSGSLINQLSLVPRTLFDSRKIFPDRSYTVIHRGDTSQGTRALVYEPNPIDYVVFHLEDTLWVELCHRDVKAVERIATGVIESSLAETIADLGLSHELTNRFVDIMAWKVDFQRLSRGDRFKIIYEEEVVENRPIAIRAIKALLFEHRLRPYYAFPYDQGSGVDYFDEEGNSLRKALLRYPIEFTRISSRYSGRRFHPVEKKYKPHLGTDFAAPTGTPIRSVGDGTVLEAWYSRGNGNYVKIRHNSTYTTQYLHMSKIEAGIRPGVRVKQGQVIGRVGSTGLATGPHLCYRFWKNGRQVDALRIALPPSEPIRANHQEAYESLRLGLTARLNAISFGEGFIVAVAN
jgi:murein DD-endopeptidase MepM/ murein hydrolase activator NlpD